MASKKDYYKILSIDREAGEDDVKKAYRRLARKYHPDLNPGDKAAEERFKSVQEAYDILSDSKKRQMYDQFGFYSDQGMPGAGAGSTHSPNMDFGGFDFSDFAKSAGGQGANGGAGGGFGGSIRDIFSQVFGGRNAGSE